MRSPHRVPPSRSRDRRAVRDRSALQHAGQVGRQHDAVQIHRPQRRGAVRQDRDVHAQAAVRRQRQRHARPSVHLEGRQAAVRGRRLCGPQPDGAALYRRTAEARARAVGDHRADHQQLQAPGAGLRSAGESGVLAAQSFGRLPHSDVLGESEGQARGVPAARSVGQSLPRVFAPC